MHIGGPLSGIGRLKEYLNIYSKGLNAKQAEFAVQKYRSHRRLGASIIPSVDMADNNV